VTRTRSPDCCDIFLRPVGRSIAGQLHRRVRVARITAGRVRPGIGDLVFHHSLEPWHGALEVGGEGPAAGVPASFQTDGQFDERPGVSLGYNAGDYFLKGRDYAPPCYD